MTTLTYCTQCYNEITLVVKPKHNEWVHTGGNTRHIPTPPPLTADERIKFRGLLNLIPINPDETIKDYVQRFKMSAAQFDVPVDVVQLMKQRLTDMSDDALFELLMRVKSLNGIENQLVEFDMETFMKTVSNPTVSETVDAYFQRVTAKLTDDQLEKVKRLLLRKYCESHFMVSPCEFSRMMFQLAYTFAKSHDKLNNDQVVFNYERLLVLYNEYEKR